MKKRSSCLNYLMGFHQVRKRFGQNLHDEEVDKNFDTISPNKQEHILEIGPGLGALTKGLANLQSFIVLSLILI